jgi:AraC family transcriptional regulator of arabinose operon
VPPGTAHVNDVETGAVWDHLWLHFLARPHWSEWLEWPGHSIGVRTLVVAAGPVRRSVVRLFRRIVHLTLSPAPDRELFALNALEELLLWCQRIKPQATAAVNDPRVHDCLEYISDNLRQVITLADLARVSRQSISRLTHQFRRQTGMTPMQYLEQRRLDRAMELLARTSMSIKDIAGTVGFENPFYFTLRFRKHSGFSPRAFRDRTSQPATILRRPGLYLNPDDRKFIARPRTPRRV